MKTFDIRPYGGTLAVTTSRESYFRKSKSWGCSSTMERIEGSNGICYEAGGWYVIGVFDGNVATLAHELVHLCFWEANRTNFQAEMDGNDEPFAYLMQDLMERILAKFPEIKAV